MTPEEINEINKKKKANRKTQPKKLSQYCRNCHRTREVEYGVIRCPVCNSYLEQFEVNPTNNTEQINTPKCPTCGSNNIKKISELRRGIHAAAWGLLSNTARSQFECNNCGYKW